MRARSFPILGLSLVPLLALGSPACDDEEDCPAGYEGCPCTAEFQCLDGLACLSEYCVSSEANASGGSGGNSTDPTDPSGAEGGSTNNVAACEAFLDNLPCALPEGVLDCSVYAEVACDVTDYLDCLTDNSSCTNDMIDVAGWANCVTLVEDCA